MYSFWKVSFVYLVSSELFPTADLPTIMILKVASSAFVARLRELITSQNI